MPMPAISNVMNEFLAFHELLDAAYWEASTLEHKDTIYDIISQFSQEIAELNKLSIQDHHYPYESITEGIRRIPPKLISLENQLSSIVKRTQTMSDMRDALSNIIAILEEQSEV
jgi:hypothetical protein